MLTESEFTFCQTIGSNMIRLSVVGKQPPVFQYLQKKNHYLKYNLCFFFLIKPRVLILATTFANSDHWKQMVVVPTLYGPITVVYGIIYMVTYMAVGVNDSDDGTTPETMSGYLPIDEPARGNSEYQALEGDDDDYAIEITRQGSRLRMKGYEVVNGSVYAKPITMPELE